MNLSRREFLHIMAAAGAAGLLPGAARAADPYDLPVFGNVGLLHYTDCHAQLMPIHYREPNVNLGIGDMKGRPPHLVGSHLLKHFGIAPGSAEAHAFTFLDFPEAALGRDRRPHCGATPRTWSMPSLPSASTS